MPGKPESNPIPPAEEGDNEEIDLTPELEEMVKKEDNSEIFDLTTEADILTKIEDEKKKKKAA